ncbi:PREDICTED: protein ripply1 isoform X1 [Miniopterus natalensis]|uniref:protein ripply1 isoform X1 n=1 Tax=Miniopterus natalensis TaxID=291302 RepID=UPI0007A6EE01|nr:PREDICTED: protein ripply1 isoform X1 [Miniopterus natalensis]
MDPSVPTAAADPEPTLALSIAPALAQGPLELPGLLSPSPLPFPGQEVDGSERGACLWRPWLCSTSDPPRQVRKLVDLATGGATSAEVTKADSKFHHPIRLFWPKSRSFDYLYSYGEILLQNFPVQATINLYEDSDSEEEDNCEEEDGDEEQEKKEADKKGPEGCLRILRSAPHRVTSHPPSPSLTCPS